MANEAKHPRQSNGIPKPPIIPAIPPAPEPRPAPGPPAAGGRGMKVGRGLKNRRLKNENSSKISNEFTDILVERQE